MASPSHSHSEQGVQIPPTNHHPSKEFVLMHQCENREFRLASLIPEHGIWFEGMSPHCALNPKRHYSD